MTNEELINKAESVLNRHVEGDRLFGDVGSALVSENGNLYLGVCVDTPTWGLCAERSAIAAMITAKEYKIKKIVAVWKDEKDGKLYVLPPCGTCREFIKRVNHANLETEVILGRDGSTKLKELLPYNGWPQPLK
jgi:cytidine deaminase